MQPKILVAAMALLALVIAVPAAASSPHRYRPKHGAKCHHGYRRVKHHGHLYCVNRAHRKVAATAPGKVKLHAHLDPTYTRIPLDPFKVTYSYSASATEDAVATPSDARAPTVEEPAPLPSGVLALYSDGQLECAVNVGSGVEGSECPVHYKELGEHRVTTIYTSGEQSATETEVEQIGPLGTTTFITTSFSEFADPEEAMGPEVQSGWYWIGDLTITWGNSPSSVVSSLGCGEEPTHPYGRITKAHCYVLSGSGSSLVAHVYARGECNVISDEPLEFESFLSALRVMESPPSRLEGTGDWPSVEATEAGSYHLRASISAISNKGYAPSEATVPLQISPRWRRAC